MPQPISTMLQPYFCTAQATMPVAPPGAPGASACMSNGQPVNLIGNVSTHMAVNLGLPPGVPLIGACLVNSIPALPELSVPTGLCMFPFVHSPTPFVPNPLNLACTIGP